MSNLPVCLRDLERQALRSLSGPIGSYVSGGAADELTVRWNCTALRRLRLRPKLPVATTAVNTEVTLFGSTLRAPLLLAPVGLQGLIHERGEIATAQGAALAGVPFIISTVSSFSLESIAAEGGGGALWFQLYPQRDTMLTSRLIERAVAIGCRAIVVTIDMPRLPVRDRERREGLNLVDFEYPNIAPSTLEILPLTWKAFEGLRRQTELPLLVKGILDPSEAVEACNHGADGIIVSNHGGRIVDTLPPTAEALPSVIEAIGNRVPVLVDGGIRRGTDVLKMLALGAVAVLVGRTYLYGLRVGGAAGVVRTIDLLREELEVAMSVIGRSVPSSIDRTVLWV